MKRGKEREVQVHYFEEHEEEGMMRRCWCKGWWICVDWRKIVLSNIIGLVKAPSMKVARTGISFAAVIGIADKCGSLGLRER